MLGTLGICLSLLASPQAGMRFVPLDHFTLAWTHSIEKIRWEEDYRLQRDAQGRAVLLPGKARIKGTGAGMEPPADAVYHASGWYEYQPDTGVLDDLRLTRSEFTDDYDFCMDGHCRSLGDMVPSDDHVTLLQPCLLP